MLIFDRRICPENLAVEFGYTLYTMENATPRNSEYILMKLATGVN
jgi:hypothetical protein